MRRMDLSTHDRDDLRQELLADLLARLKYFDPGRGSLAAFAAVVVRHGVTRLVARMRRDRALFALVSLDEPISRSNGAPLGDTFAEEDGYAGWMWPVSNPTAVLERQLSLHRALNTLPPEYLNLCADLLAGLTACKVTGSGPSRATWYRHLNDLRLCLMAAGLEPPA
jgi:DNA-directed RNA polymerase specialized sigma24 family protein